jgi:hypothetical protein
LSWCFRAFICFYQFDLFLSGLNRFRQLNTLFLITDLSDLAWIDSIQSQIALSTHHHHESTLSVWLAVSLLTCQPPLLLRYSKAFSEALTLCARLLRSPGVDARYIKRTLKVFFSVLRKGSAAKNGPGRQGHCSSCYSVCCALVPPAPAPGSAPEDNDLMCSI